MPISIVGERVVCPLCHQEVQLLRIMRAARLADVSRRTIYSYIEEGSVYAARVAGKTMRVCPACLLQGDRSHGTRSKAQQRDPAVPALPPNQPNK